MGINLGTIVEMVCRLPCRRRASTSDVDELYRTAVVCAAADDDDVDATTMSLLQNAGRLMEDRHQQRGFVVCYWWPPWAASGVSAKCRVQQSRSKDIDDGLLKCLWLFVIFNLVGLGARCVCLYSDSCGIDYMVWLSQFKVYTQFVSD